MIEIAICLAIIGFALVAILGVLPLGMHTQRDVREETIIAQDATVLLEAIRGAARGADNLTNSVFAITNGWVRYNADGTMKDSGTDGFTYTSGYYFNNPNDYYSLTNGAHIIGLLSTPQLTDLNRTRPISNLIYLGGCSNHVTAYVRCISGLAAEKPPQDNPIMVGDTFTYHLYCVNAAVAADTNIVNLPHNNPTYIYNNQLAGNLHELRLTFLWPQLPNGNLPSNPSRQTFRVSVAGQLAPDPTYNALYFYQPQSFTTAP